MAKHDGFCSTARTTLSAWVQNGGTLASRSIKRLASFVGAFGLMMLTAGVATAACNVTTASTSAAAVNFTSVGQTIGVCVTNSKVAFGLFSNQNAAANYNYPITKNATPPNSSYAPPAPYTVTTGGATYTFTPVGTTPPSGPADTYFPEYDIRLDSITTGGSGSVTLYYSSFCDQARLSPNQCQGGPTVNDGGSQTPTGPADTAFTFTLTPPAPPTITSISPNSGPTAGNQTVTITGTNFSTTSNTVSFGGTNGTVTAQTATSITVTTPANAAGAVNVVVTNNTSTRSVTATNGYTYVAAPTVTAINPNNGPTAGSQSVTITGTNFTGATAVTIGGNPATGITVVNATQITATTPAGTAGTASVNVTTAGGTNAANTLYTYVGPPTQIAATAGTPQSTTIGTAFATALSATVRDAGNNPVSGVTVTFTAPTSGASGTFGGSSSTTAMTNASGVATASTFTANNSAGTYNVSASFTGVTTPASFVLTNNPGAASQISVSSGNNQSATINTAFAAPLAVLVRDAGNNPVSNVAVTFTAPSTGASGKFGASTTTTVNTNASGIATSSTLTANATAGMYAISASINAGAQSVSFSETNTPGAAATIAVNAGNNQSAAIGTAFGTALSVIVRDSGNNPVPNVNVTFTAPSTGASGKFNGAVTTTAMTDPTGIATASTFTANQTAGNYSVTATAGTPSTAFTLTNTPGPAASIAVNAGSGQSATINTNFATNLSAKVVDAGNNPVPNVVVTFTAPSTGVSGKFGASTTTTANTDSTGIATASAFTANATAGGYNVTASAPGVTTPASFSLTNTVGPPAAVAINSGNNQSTPINTSFGAPLSVTVRDAGGNPLSGITVNITAPATGASATFSGSAVITTTTNGSGVATTPTPVANGTSGTYNVTAQAQGGTNPSVNFTLTNAPAPPTLTSIAPNSGTTNGGTLVTLTGTNFVPGTTVTIGGVSATNITVVNATTITATTPAYASGPLAKDVVVNNGTGSATLTGGFTYQPNAPTITSIAPNTGPTTGGATVTISGTEFVPGTTVTIGGVAATGINVINKTTLMAVTPAYTSGSLSKDVIVNNGVGSATLTNGYTYNASAPTLTAINPNTGPTTGGTNVTLTGANFVPGSTVTIGGLAATNVVVVSATSITATTPAYVSGALAKDVTVNNGGGSATLTGGFTYMSGPPTLTAINPNTGPTTGGSNVTLTGTNFVPGSTVTIGGIAATGITVVNATTITATTPAYVSGALAKDVVVNNGTGSATLTGGFTYTAVPPTLTAINPNTGPTTGGTNVTLTGTNFVPGSTVTIGGLAATNVVVVSATSITATTPAYVSGALAKDVTVNNGGGSATLIGGFTYMSGPPTLTAINPNTGPTTGGTNVTLTGSNFTPGSTVTIGGVAATNVVVVSATSITAMTPAYVSGALAKDVVVNNGNGNATLTGGFTYMAGPPTLTAINPNTGPAAGGTSVTLTGTNFVPGTTVTIGGVAATGVTIVNPTTIMATTPAYVSGPLAKDVTVNNGSGSATLIGGFTYNAVGPQVTTNPMSQTVASGGTATFTAAASGTPTPTVQWMVSTNGGNSYSNIAGATSTTLSFTAQTSDNGNFYRAMFTNSAGMAQTTSATLTVTSVPTVSSVTPNNGPATGGTNVTIMGTNFNGATSVTFGGTAATAFTVVSATTITATTPAHAAGAVDVVVMTPGGTGTGSGLYTYIAPVTATTLSSSKNPSEVGQAVTFTATVSSASGTPSGTVVFRDGGTVIGSAPLSGGMASFTTSSLTLGTHSITAMYSGNTSYAASTSAALLQSVETPKDSVNLRALQLLATKVVAQTSGAAISGAIDTAINDGLGNGGGSLMTPSAGGIRFNFSADPDEAERVAGPTVSNTVSDQRLAMAGNGGGNNRGGKSAAGSTGRVDDAFAAIDRRAMPTKAPAVRPTDPKDWLFWADIRGAGIGQFTGSSTGPSALYGNQVNLLLGLTRRVTPNFVIGAVGGYETFDYRSDTLNGRLKGDGWTVGSYLGWRFTPGLRFDAAAAYSGIGYNGASGTASGNFNGRRWLVSGGLTGNTTFYGLDIEPSAKVYALWENENAYTDSLGTLQADRTFFTGRASGGVKVAYPWLYSATVTLAPFAGLYADYYFTSDNAAITALAGAAPLASVPLLDGWSARAVGGIAAQFKNGAAVAFGAELGGFGSNTQIWTFKGRASVPFAAQ